MKASSDLPPRDQIATWLRKAIISGTLAPGERVREDSVAHQHGVSRVPVREAVQKLAAEGFLELERYRGAVVAVPTRRRLRELIQIRQSLEATAARLAAERKGGDYAPLLQELAAAGHSAVGAKNFETLPELVESFHHTVAKASGNEELARMLGQVREKIRWIFSQNLQTRSPQEWDDHSEITDAIVKGDPEAAAQAMNHHIARDEMLCDALSLTA